MPGRFWKIMDPQNVALPLKRFLLIEECPAAWKPLDLYLFRDESVAFYAGQSHFAFGRVWEHLLGGFKGHSLVGRFVWANWPASMKFSIELLSSGSSPFAAVGHDLNAAERALIGRWSPCFNTSGNSRPTPLPPHYRPPNAPLRCGRSFRKLLYQAAHAVQADEAAHWMQELE
jgi:hypothetical protein